jgi:uncharacterized protein (TIGR00297 family)
MPGIELILLSFVLSSLVSLLAWRVHALTLDGAAAAALTGGLILLAGGLPWAALLLFFFLSSTLLSKLGKGCKPSVEQVPRKGHRRDSLQVLANGGVAAACAVLHLLQPSAGWHWIAFSGSLAAACADTWATELGAFSTGMPRLVTNWQRVPAGTSGAVSLAGTAAAGAGAACVAILAGLLTPTRLALIPLVGLAGFFGSLVDSFLGARKQASYHCPRCQVSTEWHPLHDCGSPTVLERGIHWLDNDLVNLLCTLSGALFAAGISWVI